MMGVGRAILLGVVALAVWVRPAAAWDTKAKENPAGESDWRSIYLIPPLPEGRITSGLFDGNEHAQLAYFTLARLGLLDALAKARPPDVVDLNASIFRREALVPFGVMGPEAEDGLERRTLPPVGQFAGLPDFSYTLIDWINKNANCPVLPPGAPEIAKCHVFAGWMGALNASHFGTQAARTYRHLHAIALNQAARARQMAEKLRNAKALDEYRVHVREAEWLALAYEGVAQHFLQDRWSSGHMWERWNGADWPSIAYPKSMLQNLQVGIAAGLIHGAESIWHQVLPNKLWPDPMSAPLLYGVTPGSGAHPERIATSAAGLLASQERELAWAVPVRFRHREDAAGLLLPGVGDHHLKGMFTGRFPGRYYGYPNDVPLDVSIQREEMLACLMAGWSEVVQAFGRNRDGSYGVSRLPMTREVSFDGLGHDCFDIYATNNAIYEGWDVGDVSNLVKAAGLVVSLFGSDALSAADRIGWVSVGARIRLWRASAPDGIQLAAGMLGDFGRAKPGDAYKGVAEYWPPKDVDELPDEDNTRWRDKQALYGFFSKAAAPYWCRRMPRIIESLRSRSDKQRQAACVYLAQWAYEGTDPAYHGPQAERRGAEDPPSLCRALGISLPSGRPPLHLPPGYVPRSGLHSAADRPPASVEAWCRRLPVLYLVDDPKLKARDVVAVMKAAGETVTLEGADLGDEEGRVWIGCGPGEEREELVIERWTNSHIAVRAGPLTEPGSYTLCLARADGTESVGRFVFIYRPAGPEVRLVAITSSGHDWYRWPDNIDEPLQGGRYRLMVEFNQPMDTQVPAVVAVEGPGRVRLADGRWLDDRRWTMTLTVPEEAEAFAAARGSHRLRVTALSLGGKRIDGDPATPGAQPDDRFVFRVGSLAALAGFVGCYRDWLDDTAALEIGGDGHVLGVVDDGKHRLPLHVVESTPRKLRLRLYLDAAMLGSLTRLPEPHGVVLEAVAGPEDERAQIADLLCAITPDGRNVLCEPRKDLPVLDPFGTQPRSRTFPISPNGAYLEWVLSLKTPWKGPAAMKLLDITRPTEDNGLIRTAAGVDFSLSFAWDIDAKITAKPVFSSAGAPKGLRLDLGAQGKPPPVFALDVLLRGQVASRPPRVEALEVVGEDGKPLTDRIPADSRFTIRASGRSHCPGFLERVPVHVQRPGTGEVETVVLEETGPDTGVYQGPKAPMSVTLPRDMKVGHLIVEAAEEIKERTGFAGILQVPGAADPVTVARRASVGTRVALRIVPATIASGQKPQKVQTPPKGRQSWRRYSLEVAQTARSLPDITVIETHFVDGGDHVRLVRRRYPVSLARGSRDEIARWSIGWGSGETVSTVEGKGADRAALRQRAATLYGQGFALQELPARLAAAIGGRVQPLKDDWGPPLAGGAQGKPAAAQAKKSTGEAKETGAQGRTSRFSYNGPPYRAHVHERSTVFKGGVPIKGSKTIREIELAVMPGRMRREEISPVSLGAAGTRVVSIAREDLGVVWTLYPDARLFSEGKLNKGVLDSMTRTFDGVDRRGVHLLKRYRYTITLSQGQSKTVGTQWEDENGIVVRDVYRTTMPNGFVVEGERIVEQIQIGPVDASLFELPKGYKPAAAGRMR